jgi:hypothetical protein
MAYDKDLRKLIVATNKISRPVIAAIEMEGRNLRAYSGEPVEALETQPKNSPSQR